MTLVSEIITDAYRQSNLLAIGVSPTALQQEEALRYLNRLLKSVFGNEAGDPLTSFPIGRGHIQRPSGYPWWDTVPDNDWYVPSDTRAMLNIDRSVDLWLNPAPCDGARFQAIDAGKNLSEFPVTIHGNGASIEDQFEIVLDTDGINQTWFFQADIANWVRYSPITSTDLFPFPEEFDDYFISLLAMRLNPSYGTMMDDQSKEIMRRSKSQLAARYTQIIPVRSEFGLIRMPRMAADRDIWGTEYSYYNPNSMFEKGWPQ